MSTKTSLNGNDKVWEQFTEKCIWAFFIFMTVALAVLWEIIFFCRRPCEYIK